MLTLTPVDAFDLPQTAISPTSPLTLALSPSGQHLAILPARQQGTLLELSTHQQQTLDFTQTAIHAQFAINDSFLIIVTRTKLLKYSRSGQLLSEITASTDDIANDITDAQSSLGHQSLFYLNHTSLYTLQMSTNQIKNVVLPTVNNCQPHVFQFDPLTGNLVTSSFDCNLCLFEQQINTWRLTRQASVEECRATDVVFLNNKVALTQNTVSSSQPELVLFSSDKLQIISRVSYASRSPRILTVPMRTDSISYGLNDFNIWISNDNPQTSSNLMNFFPLTIKQAIFNLHTRQVHLGLLDARSLQIRIRSYKITYNCPMILQNSTSPASYSQNCQCSQGQLFRPQTLKCQQVFCQLDQQNQCTCNSEQSFDSYSLECRLDCSKVKRAYLTYPFGQPSQCLCKVPYAWNSLLSDCSFINCSQIANTVLTGTLGTVCQCIDGYTWSDPNLQCHKDQIVASGEDESGIDPVAIFAIVLGILLLGVLGVIMFVRKCYTPPEEEPKPFQIKTEPEDVHTSRPLGEADLGSTKALKDDPTHSSKKGHRRHSKRTR